MGYSYGQNPRTGRYNLACDSCGDIGGVRKRRCTEMVTTEDGFELHFCSPPALCARCWSEQRRVVHADCPTGAAASQREYDMRRERLRYGDYQVSGAWGSWHELVPEGWTGVRFVGKDRKDQWRLVRASEYDPSNRRWLSEYRDLPIWVTHP